MNQIKWGIIGCGDVTEVKSGPGFQKASGSALVAVMRRNGEKARDYAARHGVPKWYDDADKLINDPEVDAIYIATPPAFHAEYTLKAANAGKSAYVEKPMSRNFTECLSMIQACQAARVPLFVAYYRRCLPAFLKVMELLDSGAIGPVRCLNVKLHLPPRKEDLQTDTLTWRVQPELAGGGYFVDMGSHQLDLLDYIFGPIMEVKGMAVNQAGLYPAEDMVAANFRFESGVVGVGSWCFTVAESNRIDQTEIIGEKGKIFFSSFEMKPVLLEIDGHIQKFEPSWPQHVQQPLIQQVVNELLGSGKSPSTGETGARTSWVMDEILKGYRK
ncbi:Gfo/Idh/MocA family oxidoreductase [candidate division KSB1 bacterium]|nr:Gfo/Idh/MocA family oxidoreductase [candidate division KSB1 bacterium]